MKTNNLIRYLETIRRFLLETFQRCLTALAHGVNANLLRKWIHHYQAAVSDPKADEPYLALPAFVPVLSQPAKPKTTDIGLTITLVNGVQLTLEAVDLTELSPLLNTLANLPCSASIRG